MCIKGECNACHEIESTWQFDVLEVDNLLLRFLHIDGEQNSMERGGS